MSEYGFLKDHKYCANCTYWQGHRSVQYYGTQVVADTSEQAKCRTAQGHEWGPNYANRMACSEYQQWNVYKK